MKQTSYALATGLVGFSSSRLRVRVLERRDGCAWVVTADLLDAGTALVLDDAQVEPLPDTVPAGGVPTLAL
jgi:hypothetical protein